MSAWPPSAPLRDDFNRADSTSIGADWQNYGLKIASNTLQKQIDYYNPWADLPLFSFPHIVNPGIGGAYYLPTGVVTDGEAAIDAFIESPPLISGGIAAVGARMQLSSGGDFDGYFLGGFSGGVTLWKQFGDEQYVFGQFFSSSPNPTNWTIRVIGDVIEAWNNSAHPMCGPLLRFRDSQFPEGHFGVIIGGNSRSSADNFKAGDTDLVLPLGECAKADLEAISFSTVA